ncbi:MAG: hypothetical protein L0L18_00935 [Acidipropionibacterium jensenii]|nr:hypothetical protein [Acidipropionibacterium jensenii]
MDERKAKDRAYREKNRERISERGRLYHEKNRGYNNARKRESYQLVGNPKADLWQEITAKHATRGGRQVRWSEAEDAYLAASTDRAVDDALELKRTYNSVQHRIAHLRRSGVTLARDAH